MLSETELIDKLLLEDEGDCRTQLEEDLLL